MPALLDALVDSVIERLLDQRGAVTVREALSAVASAYVAELKEAEQVEIQQALLVAAIAARFDTRLEAPRDLAPATVRGELGMTRRSPNKKHDA